MGFAFPNTASEFVFLVVPGLTLLLGLGFLLVPRRIFRFMGLQAVSAHPEAIGEGRSSFAGFMIAIALGCLLLQDPIAKQPGLNFALALSWSIAVFGRILQMLFDGGLKRKRVQVRMILAAGIALAGWAIVENDWFTCDPLNSALTSCRLPSRWQEWFLFAVAAFTVALGLIALFLPQKALAILRLETRNKVPFARGETRGTLAGFYIAIGGTYLLAPAQPLFIALVLGAAWTFVGIGRMISIVWDRGFGIYNLAAMLFELALGLVALLIVFQVL